MHLSRSQVDGEIQRTAAAVVALRVKFNVFGGFRKQDPQALSIDARGK